MLWIGKVRLVVNPHLSQVTIAQEVLENFFLFSLTAQQLLRIMNMLSQKLFVLKLPLLYHRPDSDEGYFSFFEC